MEQIVINVDELRLISTIAVDSAQKMDEAKTVIGAVVAQHDWKCAERVDIDRSLEIIKANVLELSEIIGYFASQITEIANTYTELINEKARMNISYEQDLVSMLTEFSSDGVIAGSSNEGQVGSVIRDLESTSLNTSNVASLHSSSDAIGIVDFSTISE